MQRLYRLRWRLDLPAGTRRGMWSEPCVIERDGAWRVNKTGLVRAAVEAEELGTWQERTLAECDGWDFINFEWMARSSCPGFFRPAALTLHGAIIGLRLVTRELMLECTVDGQQKILRRPEAEKRIHLAGFGR